MSDTEARGSAVNGADSEEGRHIEPKSNYVIYTIISILLFLLLLAGYKFISGRLFRDYYIIAGQLSEENIDFLAEFSGIDYKGVSGARLEHINGNDSAVVYYSGIDDAEAFADECILYEYGDVMEDIRIEIYPYGNGTPDYAFASCYVSIDNPAICCYVYEFDDEYFAEYHSVKVSPEFSALFSGAERIYYDT